jgi:ribosomal protein S12 methylthiotransferase
MHFYLMTLGCPKNTVDSEMMAELLRQAGHVAVGNTRQAEVLIINTCGFIAEARQESYDALQQLARQKRRGQWLVAAGCMAERYAQEIKHRVPAVDVVLGTRSWPQICGVLASLQGKPLRVEQIMASDRGLVTSVERNPATGASAYLKIADGCDAACGFCAIPLIKGPQRSKQPEEVLREARELEAAGVWEINLIAQDTTAYGRDLGLDDALPGLVESLSRNLSSLLWLRILYAYPQHVTPRLVSQMAESRSICHYLDIPLQHGDPDVLQRMRRPSDTDRTLRLIESLRQAMSDIALRSTFIVGYPGETEREYANLLTFMREIHFDNVGVFAYSREEGTYAASLPDQVPDKVIEARYDQAMAEQQRISLARNQTQIGRELVILVEGAGEGLIVGRCYRQAPEIDGLTLIPGQAQVGATLQVKVSGAQEYDLLGELIQV